MLGTGRRRRDLEFFARAKRLEDLAALFGALGVFLFEDVDKVAHDHLRSHAEARIEAGRLDENLLRIGPDMDAVEMSAKMPCDEKRGFERRRIAGESHGGNEDRFEH